MAAGGDFVAIYETVVIAVSGGFYSDNIGYVAKSCKKCPDGSFVAFDKAPGTRKQDCKSCPEGTNHDFYFLKPLFFYS